MTAWRRSRGPGRPNASRSSRPAGAAPSCRWCSAPGEAFQFDWSEDWAVLGGERTKLQVAHIKLSHSRAFSFGPIRCRPTRCCSTRTTQAFRVLGGVPRRGIYDNMKTAVDKVGQGKARHVNARFAAMASHYLFEPEFCNPASGWEKGQVEKNVQDARHRLWQPMPAFADLARSMPGWRSAASRVGRDRARRAARHRGRCAGREERPC